MGKSFEQEPSFRRRHTIEFESRRRARVARDIQAVVRGLPDAVRGVADISTYPAVPIAVVDDTELEHGFDSDGDYV
ncbi:hypothetical protein UFOVP585_55 [uncultured Caudovirales phage]|uniref:Uncharacterized protein n=1 Tax=uncultured Caudovirales phage TaxID=2100421 RepID=A0A6J5N1I0_9CAUD|nr:hypothetical protein UFOVP585_55 [uncultured Caudovirales phage]